MSSAFDFLIPPGTIDWFLLHSVGLWPWPNYAQVGCSFVSMLVGLAIGIVVVNGARPNPLRVRYATACLLVLAWWTVGCTPIEPVKQLTGARQPADSGCNRPDCLPTTTMRMPFRTPPPATPQGLPVPTFSPQTGTVAFGTKIKLSVSNLPVGAAIEYSYDNGKTWIPGDQAAVLGTEPILSRTRINDLTSNPSQAAFKPFYRRMMVIGNSIMNHAPQPATGWFNHNGMAASAPDKDFVHVLTAYLAQQYPQVAVRLVSGGNFERHFSQPEYSLDEFNEPLREFKPDLIVVRLGENVDEGNVFSPIGFEAQYRRLLDRLATYSGQPARIICTTSVWKRPQSDAMVRRVTREKGILLVDLSDMVGQDQYFAIGQYANVAVAAHPNDTGMKRIADLIWQKLP